MNGSKRINKRRLGLAGLFLAALAVCGPVAKGLVQEQEVNLAALIGETQKISPRAGEVGLVWWIPEDYWRVCLGQNPNVTKAQIEAIVKTLDPYTIVVVVAGKVGPLGGVTYNSEAELRGLVQIKDGRGTLYRPLAEEKLSPDARNVLSMMRPVFANLLGPMGRSMHFFAFPCADKKGRRIARAKEKGTFAVRVGQREYKWRLPLNSLVPPKMCAKCGERCSGAWNFCPWCGTKLPVSGQPSQGKVTTRPAKPRSGR